MPTKSNTSAPSNPDSMGNRLAHLDHVIAFSLVDPEKYDADRKTEQRDYYRANRESYLATQKAYQKANPEKRKEIELKRKYGISALELANMIKHQNERCLICKTKFGSTTQLKPHVDHCHKTGKIRGILCGACNRGLGHMRDNPVILRAAIRYLKAHQPDPTTDLFGKVEDGAT